VAYPNADVVSPGAYILHYQVQQRLGAGGMGVVYKALDTRLKRAVALKFLPPDLGSDPGYRERFLREAMAASAIDHPNMGTVFAIEDWGAGCQFIVMAYYDGETLRDRLMRGPLPPVQAIDIAIQAASGLAKAHERGIIHRDIKPSNLMVTRDGVVKIVDFGLARMADSENLTITGATVGTAAYMSPEQVVHGPMDQRTDLWSLGVVMHEMLRGERPFHGESAVSLLYSVVHHPPDPLIGAPPSLAAVVERCLKKSAEERYPTAREMIADLERARERLNNPASTQTQTLAMAVESGSSNRKLMGIAALVLVLVAGGAFVWRELAHRAPPTLPQTAVPAAAVVSAPPAPKPEPPPEQPATASQPAAKPTPPAVKLPPLRRPLSAAEYGGPLSGELQWSGTLAAGGTLTIQAGHATAGSLSDDLPLAPVTVEAVPPGVQIVEAPSARNQWDRIVLRNGSPNAVNSVTVRWKIASNR
jgi:serine/threonine protein kinase